MSGVDDMAVRRHSERVAVNAAARVLYKRLRIDLGIRAPWDKLTPDDKEAFRADVRAVARELEKHRVVPPGEAHNPKDES